MKTTTFQLTARDPIVSRDGRPFGAGQGNRMRSVDWPLPSVIAGSFRTALGKGAGRSFSHETADELLRVSVAGVFPTVDDRLYLPAPQDCVVHPKNGPLHATPQEIEQGGGDWSHVKLQPVMLSQATVDEDFKPINAPAWWPVDRFTDWLLGTPFQFDRSFLQSPRQEDRTHASLLPQTGAADEGQLFTTTGLALSHLERYGVTPVVDCVQERFAKIGLSTRVQAEGWCAEYASGLSGHYPTGGERRLVHWQAIDNSTRWECPDSIRSALQNANHVRMALATPAIFHDGWKPGWLNDDLIGSPPGSDVRLELVGLTIQRWRAISGWSLARINHQGQLDDQHGHPGPKPIRRSVPAGGIYFFNVIAETPASLANCWLHSVSDHEQDQRDGFGLATWGIW